MIKAVIFDLDDTLISEKQYVKSGFKHIAKIISQKTGLSPCSIYGDLFYLYEKDSQKVFNRLLNRYNIDYNDAAIEELVREYRNHFPTLELYSDVLPCLDHLKSENIKTGIITDGYVDVQRQKIESIKAYNYFEEIILTDILGREYWKPHPKSFKIMRNRLKVEYRQMIFVGDNPQKDFYINKLLPIITVRVLRGGIYKDADYLGNYKENYLINRLEELSIIIQKEKFNSAK